MARIKLVYSMEMTRWLFVFQRNIIFGVTNGWKKKRKKRSEKKRKTKRKKERKEQLFHETSIWRKGRKREKNWPEPSGYRDIYLNRKDTRKFATKQEQTFPGSLTTFNSLDVQQFLRPSRVPIFGRDEKGQGSSRTASFARVSKVRWGREKDGGGRKASCSI